MQRRSVAWTSVTDQHAALTKDVTTFQSMAKTARRQADDGLGLTCVARMMMAVRSLLAVGAEPLQIRQRGPMRW